MIWTFMRRLPSRYLVAGVLLSFAAYGFFSRDMAWRGELIRAISAAGLPLVVTGPVLSGIAGYETWQWRRRLGALASGLPVPQAIASAPWWGVAGVGMAVQAFIMAAHTITAALSGAVVGTWTIWPVVVQLAGVCGYAALGALVGWYVPSPLAAPGVAIGLIAANVLGPASGLTVRELTDVGYEGNDFIGITYNPAAVGLQLACLAGLIVAIALPRRVHTPARIASQSIGIGLAIVTGGVLLVEPPPRVVADENMPVACTAHQAVTVCGPAIWPESQRQQLAELIVTGTNRLRDLGIANIPHQFEIETRAAKLARGTGLISIDNSGTTSQRQLRTAVVIALTSAATCFDLRNPNAPSPNLGELNTRTTLAVLLAQPMGAYLDGQYDPTVISAIEALPTESRLAWIRDAYARVWQCDPTVNLPDGVTPRSQ